MRLILAAALGLILASSAQAQPQPLAQAEAQAQAGAPAQEQVSPLDRLVHEQLLVLDTHLDTPALLHRPGWDIGDYHHYSWDVSQVDIPRMAQGGLDGGFFVIYTRQGPLTPEGYAAARSGALVRAAEIQRMVAGHPDVFAFATKPEDAARIAAQGKRIVYQSIENSYPLGTDLGLLETFHRLGVRMAGPVHSKNNQFADSATDKPRWNGLSPLGRAWVAEMNRLGMLIDASHASDAAFDQMLALSKAPIILSHSGPKAMFDHPRNLDDDRLRKLARAGGVMQLNSLYLEPFNSDPDRNALHDRQEQFQTLAPAEQRKLLRDAAALDAKRPYVSATFDMFMNSLLHAIKVMGVDHVGIGADWDGGGGVLGMEDVTTLPRITARLRRAGYSEGDIAKIWSGNLLRLLAKAQAGAQPAVK
jgi:membrane dipeptidase